MAADNQIVLEQMDQLANELLTQLYNFKKTVADLREKMADVSTTAIPGSGLLSDEQKAAILNKREKALAKRYG